VNGKLHFIRDMVISSIQSCLLDSLMFQLFHMMNDIFWKYLDHFVVIYLGQQERNRAWMGD
jgi:hypothetical protein